MPVFEAPAFFVKCDTCERVLSWSFADSHVLEGCPVAFAFPTQPIADLQLSGWSVHWPTLICPHCTELLNIPLKCLPPPFKGRKTG